MDFNFSLIFPSMEKQKDSYSEASHPNITHRTCDELGLLLMLDLKSSDISDFFTTDEEVIKYRMEAFRDMLDNPALKDVLMSVVPVLNDIMELRRLDSEASETTESYLLSITEIELYISCVDRLNNGLKDLRDSLKSRAFITLSDRMKELAESDYYRNLNKKLNELTQRVREIRSITVGVNLDAQLRPASAGVLSINSEPFKSGELLEKILRLNFKDDQYTCIASLVPFGKGQNENTKTALSYAFNTAINDVFKASIKSWKHIVHEYVLDNTDFLLRIQPEFEFLAKGTDFMRALSDIGCPLCTPELSPVENKDFCAKGLYNPSVALQISDSIVQNDFSFDEDGRIFVLTGPNRGGKSVITCAVGLAQSMVQLGMFAPADSLCISPVDGIYTHFPIGADDTIDKGRLGEECVRLGVMFDKISENSLVLLDESFSSTGAYEASYIAADVLMAFSKIGCRVIFSTHLHELSAQLDDINARCAELGGTKIDSLVARITDGKRSFRIDRIKPDGKSYARDIANKYGLSYDQIIDRYSGSKN